VAKNIPLCRMCFDRAGFFNSETALLQDIGFFAFVGFLAPNGQFIFDENLLFGVQRFHVEANKSLRFGFGVDVGVGQFFVVAQRGQCSSQFYPCILYLGNPVEITLAVSTGAWNALPWPAAA
jgi:hypothetical protein